MHYIIYTHTTHTHISMYQHFHSFRGGCEGSTLICPGERSLLPVNTDCLLQITLCQIIAVCMLRRHVLRHYSSAHIHPAVHAGALQTLRPRSVPNSKVPTASMEGESPTNNEDKYIVIRTCLASPIHRFRWGHHVTSWRIVGTSFHVRRAV